MSQLVLPPYPGGRPTDYNTELVEEICNRVSSGLSLRKVSMMDDMPEEGTIYRWLAKYTEFSEKYTTAASSRTIKYMDECVDLADTLPDGVMFLDVGGNLHERDEVLALTPKERAEAGLVPVGLTNELINKRKLQVETRMKAAKMMNPKKYGDVLKNEVSGPDGGPIQTMKALTEDELRTLANLNT